MAKLDAIGSNWMQADAVLEHRSNKKPPEIGGSWTFLDIDEPLHAWNIDPMKNLNIRKLIWMHDFG